MYNRNLVPRPKGGFTVSGVIRNLQPAADSQLSPRWKDQSRLHIEPCPKRKMHFEINFRKKTFLVAVENIDDRVKQLTKIGVKAKGLFIGRYS
jgi:hypothetical protein